jgi:PAS domain S-box-containing protein
MSPDSDERPPAWLQACPIAAVLLSKTGVVLSHNTQATPLLPALERLLFTRPADAWPSELSSAELGATFAPAPVSSHGDAFVAYLRPRPALPAGVAELAFDQLPLNISLKDEAGHYLFLNQRACEGIGLPRTSLVGCTDDDVYPPDVAQAQREADAAVMRTREARLVEEQVELRGEPRVMWAGKAALSHEGGTYLLGYSIDITARRRAEEELARQKDFVRLVADSDPNLVFAVDSEGRVSWANRTAAELLGLSRTRPSRASGDPAHKQDSDAARQRLSQLLDAKLPEHSRRVVTAWGEERSFQIIERPLRSHTGEHTLVVGIDVTEHRRAVEQLALAKDAAERFSQAKSEFLATMSHEIRTPMNGVLNLTELLLDSPLSPEQRRQAQTIRRSAEALIELTNDILDLSRVEAGKLSVTPALVDVAEIVETAVELLEPRARTKGLAVDVHHHDDVPDKLLVDGNRFRQIVLNFVSNAIKFTERGRVSVFTSCKSTGDGVATLRLEVEDTGSGIPPYLRPKIFEQFAQGNDPARQSEGTGLGLAITQRLARAMGGEVGFSSELGVGSTFWVELPAPLPTATLPASPAAPPARERALIWSQSSPEVRSLRRALAQLGVSAEPVRGLDALVAGLCSARSPLDVPIRSVFVAAELVPEPGRQRFAHVCSATGTQLFWLGPAPELKDAVVLARPIEPQALEALFAREAKHAPSAPPCPDTEREPAQTPSLRVLLVEDNAINQEVARRFLETANCHVDIAANGRLALEQLQRSSYDVILMDMLMPEMDGLEATRRIRALPGPSSQIPILAMTANAQQRELQSCLDAGMDEVVPKPVDRAHLVAAVQAWAGRSAARDRAQTPDAAHVPHPPSAHRAAALEDSPSNDADSSWLVGNATTSEALGAIAALTPEQVDALWQELEAELAPWLNRLRPSSQQPTEEPDPTRRAIAQILGRYGLTPPACTPAGATLPPDAVRAQASAALAWLRRATQKPPRCWDSVRALLGPSLAFELRSVFVEQWTLQTRLMHQALTTADPDAVLRAAATLRASAQPLGLTRIAQQAAEIEAQAKLGCSPQLAAMVQALAQAEV